ncbi:MAG: glycosyltransferase family 9 protein [bacterium]
MIKSPLKVLFFRIGAIGDVLLTTPAVKLFKEKHPDSIVHYYAGPKAAEILRHNPYIDKIIIFNETHHKLSRFLRVLAMSGAIKKSLNNETYDIFFDFESSYYSAYISMCVKTKHKIGFKLTDPRRAFLNTLYKTRVTYFQGNTYIALRFLALLNAFETYTSPSVIKPILHLAPEEVEKASLFYSALSIAPSDYKILFSISGTWPTKKWPVSHWIILANLLNHLITPKHIKIIILWGPGDEADVKLIRDAAYENVYFVPACGLRDLAGITGAGHLLVGNDTGVRHIANALGVPVIGLFGPTNEKGWAYEAKDSVVMTSNVPCRPCDKTNCADTICMKNITAEAVLEKIKLFL